jgi:ADP-heptose:LPS heptosyltransferase
LKILLVRVDGVGDALALTPLIVALRDAGHELGAVLSTRNADVFASTTFAWRHILERIPWPKHGSTAESRARALAEARLVGYDVALIASEEADAYRFARELGIPRRVGFAHVWEKPLKNLWLSTQLTRRIVRPGSARRANEHEVQTLFRLGEGLSSQTRPTRFIEHLAPMILDEPVVHHAATIVQWVPKLASVGFDGARAASLIRELVRAPATHGDVRIVAADADATEARRIASESDVVCEIPDGMRSWKVLLAGASYIVTPDSGAAHVAGMLGVPCVTLFAQVRTVARDIVRWRPWAAPSQVIVLDSETLIRFEDAVIEAVDGLVGSFQ